MQYVNFPLTAVGMLCACLWLASPAYGMGRAEPHAPRTTRVGDDHFVRMDHFADFYGFNRSRPDGNRWLLRRERDGLELDLEMGSRRIRLNGVVLFLHEPVALHRRHWLLPEADVRTVVGPLLFPAPHLKDVGFRAIMLDPGHGGTDPGGRGPAGTLEKDVVLAITLKTAEILRAAGHTVELTRSADQALALEARVAAARERGAELFVSIHLNTSANSAARGTETFVLAAGGHRSTSDHGSGPFAPAVPANAFDGANQLLAYSIHRHMLHQTGNEDRGIRRSRFFVLREAVCPAVLVECAFLTHADEERNLTRVLYQQQIAQGIAQGIMEYMGIHIRSQLEAL